MKKMTLWMAAVLFAAWAMADVRLDPVFTSNMMLQQGAPIAFFGTAPAEKDVTATFGDETVTVKSDAQGKWRAVFAPKKAGKETFAFFAKEGNNTIQLVNIIIGDVWLCAGQSNMEMPVGKTFRRGWSAQDCEKEVAAANYPEIRYADQARRVSLNELQKNASYQFGSGWVVCSPKVADRFSATAYFFARQLHKDLDIPIGLINTTWSGTRIEPWISKQGYEAAKLEGDLAQIAKNADIDAAKKKELSANADAQYKKALADWEAKVAAAPEAEKANLQKQKPRRSTPINENAQFHCNLYNGMVDAWTTLPIKGVIWYQGCSNAGNPHYYPLHKALIADWRAKWNNPTMPFLIVQLASFGGPEDWQNAPCEDAAYALTRDIQAKVASEDPNVGLACAIDIGEHRNIHPANKQEVGRRLALEAERIAYGKNILSRGPMLDKTAVEGNAIRVFYKNAPNGLKTTDGQPPRCFAIAGADKKFVWANAKIDGLTVVVSSPDVANPMYVRYAYAAYRGDCNLQNAEGLAAYPFRSDAFDYANVK